MIHSYPFYIADWRESETRLAMNCEERGLYRELLDYCWWEGTLPNNDVALRRIAGVTEKEFKRSWPSVQVHFHQRDGRLHHAKVDSERPRLESWREARRQAGKKGGKSKAIAQAIATPIAVAQLKPPSSSPSSSSSYTSPLPPANVFDAADKIDSIVRMWPTTSAVEMGRRLLADAIAQAANQDQTLTLATTNLERWAGYYRTKPAQYRKSLANVMRDGDWMHQPPNDESGDF